MLAAAVAARGEHQAPLVALEQLTKVLTEVPSQLQLVALAVVVLVRLAQMFLAAMWVGQVALVLAHQ